MEISFSLQYYDSLFGRRTSGWAELVRALADEVEAYGGEVAAAAGGRGDLAAVRHSHRPSLANLGHPLPEPADGLTDDEAAAFGALARSLAARLRAEARRATGEPSPAVPGPPPPCPGD